MIRRTLVCLSICLIGVACGPDDDRDPDIKPGNNPTNNTNNGTNSGTNNGTLPLNNGFGEACRGVECPETFRCIAGVCVDESLKVACENPDDQGLLAYGETYTGEGDTAGFADSIRSYCGAPEDEFSGAENVILFHAEEDGRAEFTVTSAEAIEWLVEVRENCGDPGPPPGEVVDPEDPESPMITSGCSIQDDYEFNVKANTDYYIVVEPEYGIDKGTFEWTLTLTQDLCEQGRTCMDDDTILECFAGVEENTYSCGTGCDQGVCAGDSCADPIVVEAAMSWSGDARAFTDTLDFETSPTCGDGEEGIPTPGPDLVLSLPGLTAGQTVTIDASMNDDNDNAIFVLDQCSETACLASQDLGDYLEWTVEADGDYFVAIDKLTSNPQTFNYAIDIQ